MKQNQIIDEIKNRLDIVDIISQYIDLKKSGQNWKGLCPFHNEKTPSFTVSQSKQFYHCFGCGKGGDIFGFLIEKEGYTFSEALKELAIKAGVKLEDFNKEYKSETSSIKEYIKSINKEAVNFFQENLSSSSQAKKYLKERMITEQIKDKFLLGYAPTANNSLLKYLKNKGFEEKNIKESKLVYFGAEGNYDFFRGRLMFPIFDLQGNIIAFGGRNLLELKETSKYINTPETPIFKKGQTIYGLNFAKQTINEKKYSIIVEGYIDVIMCHQFDFTNVVAPLGTALTDGHLKILKRFSNKMVLVFDGDIAGVNAAKRSLEIIAKEDCVPKVSLLPKGEDPDTILRKQGGIQFKKYIGGAITPIKFMFRTFGKDRFETIKQSINLINIVPNSIKQEDMLKELSESAGIDEQIIREELKKNTSKKIKNNVPVLNTEVKNKEEEMLLGCSLVMPEKIEYIITKVNTQDFENNLIKSIFEKIKEYIYLREEFNIENFISFLESEKEKSIVTRLFFDYEKFTKEEILKIVEACRNKINIKKMETKIKETEKKEDNLILIKTLLEQKKGLKEEINY